MTQKEHYRERKEPEPPEGHLHACKCCRAAIICFCLYPEKEFNDQWAYCDNCRALGCQD